MSEIDLYELTKQKYEAQLKLETLKDQGRLNSLRKTSNELDNAIATHCNNVKKMQEITDDFKQNVQLIVEKLECDNYVNIDRESGAHLKNVFEKGFEIFRTKFGDSQFNEMNLERVDPFLAAANKRLQKQQEFLNAAEDLCGVFSGKKNSDSVGGQKASSMHSDDTINTIVSDNVFASSPI